MTPISGSKPTARKHISFTSGFTLLELLLVLAIIGLASVLIFPNVGNLDARSFNVQVREANTLLNYARRNAVVRGQPSTVRLFAGDAGEAETEFETSNLVASWESEDIRMQFLDSTEQLTDIESSIDITFFPEGGSTGGTLMLAFESQQAQILIDPFTGRISKVDEDVEP